MAKKRKAARNSRMRRQNSMLLGTVKLQSFDHQTKQWTTSATSENWQKPDELSEIDDRLNHWGIWARKQPIYLGYPRRTAESRAGEGVRDKNSKRPEPTDIDAEEIEAIVVALPDNLTLIAMKHYVHNNGSVRQRARDLSIGNQKYYKLVESLHYAVLSIIRYNQQKD